MSTLFFKITMDGNFPLSSQSGTLDEVTRELPQGFYTTFSTLSGGEKVLGLRAHLQRLYAPAAEMGLVPSVGESTLRLRVAGMVKMNLPQESRVRLILTKDDGTVYIGIQPFTPIPESVYRDGVHVITSSVSRSDPRIKGTDFIMKSVEQRKLVRGDVFEILLTHDGKILEGMTSNFYAIEGKMLVTARSGILLGVTRRAVLRIARDEGMSIEYRSPKVGGEFDEAFLTSSSRGVVPIVSIDQNPVGQGKVGKWAATLSKAYQAYVEKKSERIVE
jgi:branched-subunit amino acid aminotransferase/4-amino-4-deoxychorismate lyase